MVLALADASEQHWLLGGGGVRRSLQLVFGCAGGCSSCRYCGLVVVVVVV